MGNFSGKNKDFFVFLIYAIIGVLLFGSLLNKSFAADDFQVVYRVARFQDYFHTGFFRPLSDLTIAFNYFYGGYAPFAYFSFNLLIHLGSAFLLYRFVQLSLPVWKLEHPLFPFFTGLLFLVYPFHNEPLMWVVGRGASLSTFFGLSALCIALSPLSLKRKTWGVSIAYFLSLAAYETLAPLPLLVLLFFAAKYKIPSQYLRWLWWGLLVLAMHLVVRYFLSGSVLGDYGAGVLQLTTPVLAGHFLRIMARLWVPPMENSQLFLYTALAMGLLLTLLIGAYWRKNKEAFRWGSPLVLIGIALLLAVLVPMSFPVSTRTSETDRLLYFPSVWVCLLVAFLIFQLCRHRYLLFLAIFWVLGASVYFLEQNKDHWREASTISRTILSAIGEKTKEGKSVALINLPDEYKGAFIFRMGFQEALLMNQIDTSRVRTINLLKPQDHPGPIRLTIQSADSAQLPPGFQLLLSNGYLSIRKEGRELWQAPAHNTVVGYWDKQDWHWAGLPFNNANE